jgi:ATP-dependent RNA helicase RhlE
LKTFDELDLIPALQRALAEEQYSTPTPIQAKTIPAALMGRDILGCAQTGTGKTAAFALPILNRLGSKSRKATPHLPKVLVLAPTRELAIQIGDSFETYGRHLGLKVALVYGGVGQGKQVQAMESGVHILVATPGRLLDLMNQEQIELSRLEVFVLDEADRMLDMGFLPDLKRIIKELPRQRQSLFFSATMPPKIIELAQQLLSDPVSVNVTPKQTSVERIEQQVMFVEKGDKVALLRQILSGDDVERAIVFTKTKHGANGLTEKLARRGIISMAIHGNKSQGARQRALEAFRSGSIRVLVATDVAARGIDIDGVSHVINFDLPTEPESYVHRIGRTGRAGADGIALTLCGAAERGDLRIIERLIGKKIPAALFKLEPEPPLQELPESMKKPERSPSTKSRTGQSGGREGNRPPAKKRAANSSSTTPEGGTKSYGKRPSQGRRFGDPGGKRRKPKK